MNKPTPNAEGEYENCAFHTPRGCTALKTWYNVMCGAHCEGCPFFKTREQFNASASKYTAKEVMGNNTSTTATRRRSSELDSCSCCHNKRIRKCIKAYTEYESGTKKEQ